MSSGFQILWNFLIFQEENLVWVRRRHWNAINKWGRAFTRAGPAVKEVHLIQGPGKWTSDCCHHKDWTTWFLMQRLLMPRFLYLCFLCGETHLCPNRDTINVRHLTIHFLPSFDRTFCYCLVANSWTLQTVASVHGISHARILEWVTISSSKECSQLRDQSRFSSIAGRLFITEQLGSPPNPSI